MKNCVFFSNGNTGFFDEKGRQVSKLQRSWLQLYIEFLEKEGGDPTEIEFILPNGDRAQVFKTPRGRWNWEVKEF